MKKILVLAVTILALFSAVACGAVPTGQTGYTSMTQEEAKKKMDDNFKGVILDVRTKEEYDQGHIKNAILVPNESIDKTPPRELPDKQAEILVYCRSGNRSKKAAEKLAAMGYTHVLEFGGIITWKYGLVK